MVQKFRKQNLFNTNIFDSQASDILPSVINVMPSVGTGISGLSNASNAGEAFGSLVSIFGSVLKGIFGV